MQLDHLNKSQKAAVVQTDGPTMILAGAGSGKTRTLVSRIQYLLEHKNISPYQVLALTFSNKAAREMRERIADSSACDVGALQVTTFHAFCARVLRNEASHLGLSRSFTIYDQGESRSVIKAILGRRGIGPKEQSPYEVQYYIEELKNLGHFPGNNHLDANDLTLLDDPFYEYYKEYEEELHKSNATDFGGLIVGVLQLFAQYPEVLERYQKRYHYILVDEYQDTNRAQFRLIELLADKRRNLCVVGDEDQSIYSWRGADIRNILEFESKFSEAQIIKLEQNYRSSKTIINAATQVIGHNLERKGKEMWTDNSEGDLIQLIECRDDKSESLFVATEIKKILSEGVEGNDIAVFYRTNAQARLIEDALRQARIPYKVVAGLKFYERKEIKDLVAYMRVVVNPKDSLALSRVINVPTRGIGATTLRKIEEESIRRQGSLWETICSINEDYDEFSHLRLSSKVRSGLNSFISLIEEVILLEENGENLSFSYEKLLSESGYMHMLKSDKSYESQARIENLEELLSGIKQYEEEVSNARLVGYLETITLDSEPDKNELSQDQSEVSLMTIHGSKGLEYEYVFVTGLEESIFPSFQSMQNGESAIEEERRLFYVAMTRAMRKLYLLFAQGRMLWGSLKFNGPARFIDEIPEQYLERHFYRQGKLGTSREEDFDEFSQLNPFEDEPIFYQQSSSANSKFTKGVAVKHSLYGRGTVLSSQGVGQDEKVVIQFKNGEKKKFMANLAPIELV